MPIAPEFNMFSILGIGGHPRCVQQFRMGFSCDTINLFQVQISSRDSV